MPMFTTSEYTAIASIEVVAMKMQKTRLYLLPSLDSGVMLVPAASISSCNKQHYFYSI